MIRDSFRKISGRRIFISYTRGGLCHAWALQLQREFEAAGVESWLDEGAIAEGDQNWVDRFVPAIARADAVVCLVAGDTEDSRWVIRELLTAEELSKPVVPVRLAPAPAPN